MSLFFCFFLSSFMFIKFFEKKLIPLLSLEFMMILLIFMFFCFYSDSSSGIFSLSLIFLVFMVLDSVFGICLLVASSRSSVKVSFYLS